MYIYSTANQNKGFCALSQCCFRAFRARLYSPAYLVVINVITQATKLDISIIQPALTGYKSRGHSF